MNLLFRFGNRQNKAEKKDKNDNNENVPRTASFLMFFFRCCGCCVLCFVLTVQYAHPAGWSKGNPCAFQQREEVTFYSVQIFQ